jgi:hypothetical protein
MHFKTKVVITCLVVGGILGASLMTQLLKEIHYSPPSFPVEIAEKPSVDELETKFEAVGTLVLPTWMPGQVKLQEVYFIGMALLVYSDENMVIDVGDDLLEGKIWIELTKTHRSPTPEELMNRSSGEVAKVGDYLVVIHENPVPGPKWKERGMRPIHAYFYHDGYYYLIGGRKGETTREDLIRIVKNMKPVGSETLRKVG